MTGTLTTAERFFEHVLIVGEHWLWIGAIDKDGHGVFHAEGGHTEQAHRFAYEMAHGELPPTVVVRHQCPLPNCVRPEHMLAGTPQQNVADRVHAGRSACGEANGRALLTVRQVRSIRAQTDAGANQHELARQYHVDPKTIWKIANRITWKNA